MPELLHAAANNWGYLVTIGAVLAAVWRCWPFVRRIVHLVDDLAGEPERDGVPGRPGVMVRLRELESRTKELRHNGGGSIKDAIVRIDERTQVLDERTEHLGQRLDAVERMVVPDREDHRPRRWVRR